MSAFNQAHPPPRKTASPTHIRVELALILLRAGRSVLWGRRGLSCSLSFRLLDILLPLLLSLLQLRLGHVFPSHLVEQGVRGGSVCGGQVLNSIGNALDGVLDRICGLLGCHGVVRFVERRLRQAGCLNGFMPGNSVTGSVTLLTMKSNLNFELRARPNWPGASLPRGAFTHCYLHNLHLPAH